MLDYSRATALSGDRGGVRVRQLYLSWAGVGKTHISQRIHEKMISVLTIPAIDTPRSFLRVFDTLIGYFRIWVKKAPDLGFFPAETEWHKSNK